MKIRDDICMRCQGKDKNLKDGVPPFLVPPIKWILVSSWCSIARIDADGRDGYCSLSPTDNAEKSSGLPIPVHGPSCKATCGLSTLFPLSLTKSTPIDEISRQVRIYAMAFPSIFPGGIADWNEGRQRSVTLAEWGEHLLRCHDGPFGRHPRFRYLLFNQIMRSRARGRSTYYVNKEAELIGMALDALAEALEKGDSLLNRIVRQGKGQTFLEIPWYETSIGSDSALA
jgi:hypothetical protein